MARSGTKIDRYEEDRELLESIQPEKFSALHDGQETIEDFYRARANISKRKRLGQFFTPKPVADIMAEWITHKNPKTVLDPSIGTGVLIQAVDDRMNNRFSSDVFDIDHDIITYFKERKLVNCSAVLHNKDFLLEKIEKKYDAVIMNPPYIRHHDIVYPFDMHSAISRETGGNISRLANAYILFVMKACGLIKEGGRGAFIIPTEWMNANFGIHFKNFLLEKCGLSKIIYFSNCSTVFDDALTTACVVLIEKDKPVENISVSYIELEENSIFPKTIEEIKNNYGFETFSNEILFNTPKWDNLFRSGAIKIPEGFVPLAKLGTSKRGIATGANDYFYVRPEVAATLSRHHLKPCVGRAADVKGLIFTTENYTELKKKQKKCVLVDFEGEYSASDKHYISRGLTEGLNKRYLLSKRTPWYSMEKRSPAPIWAAVFGRKNLRFIYNEAAVYNLTTFHGFYPYSNDTDFIRALVFCLNSTVVQNLARSNIRVYGGGLIKFEPKDLLEIHVPDLRCVSDRTIKELSVMLGQEVEEKKIEDLMNQVATKATKSKFSGLSSTAPPTGLTNASCRPSLVT